MASARVADKGLNPFASTKRSRNGYGSKAEIGKAEAGGERLLTTDYREQRRVVGTEAEMGRAADGGRRSEIGVQTEKGEPKVVQARGIEYIPCRAIATRRWESASLPWLNVPAHSPTLKGLWPPRVTNTQHPGARTMTMIYSRGRTQPFQG